MRAVRAYLRVPTVYTDGAGIRCMISVRVKADCSVELCVDVFVIRANQDRVLRRQTSIERDSLFRHRRRGPPREPTRSMAGTRRGREITLVCTYYTTPHGDTGSIVRSAAGETPKYNLKTFPFGSDSRAAVCLISFV